MSVKLSKIIQNIILVGLAFLLFIPLLVTPGTLYPALFGKTVLFQVIVEILLILGFISLGLNWRAAGKRQRRKTSAFLVLAVTSYFLIRFLAGILGQNPEKSFWGEQMRMGGNFTYLHFLGFFLLLVMFVKTRKLWDRFLKLNVLVGVLAAGFAIAQNYFPEGTTFLSGSGESIFKNRISGSFGNPIFLASYVLFQIFFCALLLVRNQRTNLETEFSSGNSVSRLVLYRAGYSLALILNIFVLFLTQTRGALLAFITGVFLFLGFLIFLNRGKIRKIAVVILFLLTLSLAGIWLARDTAMVRSILPLSKLTEISRSSNTAQTRLTLWEIALKGWREHFWLGWGSENFELIFDKYYEPELLHYSFYETWADRPHNLVLQIASTSGILGLLSYLAIFVMSFWILLSRTDNQGLKQTDNHGLRTDNHGLNPWLSATQNPWESENHPWKSVILVTALLVYFIQNLFAFDTTASLLMFVFVLAFICRTDNHELKQTDNYGLNPWKSAPVFIGIMLVILLSFSWKGNIKSLHASYYANQVAHDIFWKNASKFEYDFKQALSIGGPYEDEIRKMFADDLIKGGAGNKIPPKVIVRALPAEIEAMKETVKSHPNVFAQVYRLGQLLTMAGQHIDPKYFEESEIYLKQAAGLSPGRQVVSIALGELKLLQKEPDEAAVILKNLVEQDNTLSAPHWLLGLAYIGGGDMEQGILEIEEARRLGYALKGEAQITYLIDLYDKRGNYEKIVPLYKDLIFLQPGVSDWHAGLAATYAKLGMTEEARREVLKAVVLEPGLEKEAKLFLEQLEY